MIGNVIEAKICQENRYILAFNFTNNQQIIHLDESQYSIGRSPENSIVIESEAISRFHATIVKQVNKDGNVSFFLVDGVPHGEPSRNGLFVNGNKCSKHKLKHGDIIQFDPEIQANYYEQDFSPSPSDLRKFASLIELSPNPILEIDYQGNVIYANSSAKLHFRDLKQTQRNHPILRGLFNNNQSRQGNLLVREITINQVVFEQHIHYLPQEKLIRSYLFDVTQRREAEEILKHQAFHDDLTGLPNRIFFNEHLSLALSNAQRNQTQMAIFLLDVDGFKNINDTLGHSIGDLYRSFIQDLHNNTQQQAIVAAIMTLSRGLNLRVVAEGIENRKQLTILKTLGCEEMQGYFFSPPLNPQQMIDFFKVFEKQKTQYKL